MLEQTVTGANKYMTCQDKEVRILREMFHEKHSRKLIMIRKNVIRNIWCTGCVFFSSDLIDPADQKEGNVIRSRQPSYNKISSPSLSSQWTTELDCVTVTQPSLGYDMGDKNGGLLHCF